MTKQHTSDDRIGIYRREDTLVYELSGDWKISSGLPVAAQLKNDDDIEALSKVRFDTTKLGKWDSSLLHFLLDQLEYCRRKRLIFQTEDLPEAAKKLITLTQIEAAQENALGDISPRVRASGRATITATLGNGIAAWITFIGEAMLSLIRLLKGKSRLRRCDFFAVVHECGPNALPIVSLISFLVGLIIAFLGAVVLQPFGLRIYITDLMGNGILREMGAVMTGVIMAGRTGAAFAAEIGSMKVNEELDALKSFGISPMEFIVLPRLLALSLMMPLLTLFANIIAILGGLCIAVQMLDISLDQYLQGMQAAVEVEDFLLGIVKAGVFGIVVAFAGCLRGMQCGSSADDVGRATTSAVVTGITLVIFCNSLIDVADWILASRGLY